MTSLAERVVALEESLEGSRIPHAFGGALALAFHVEEPRATRDVDLNVFVEPTSAREVFEALPGGVEWSEADRRTVLDAGQVRLFWDETPLDLFFASHPFHAAASSRVERVPFDGIVIPILGASDLVVFKAFFDRTRDWGDIEAIVEWRPDGLHEALGWLVDLLGSRDERVERLRAILRNPPTRADPRFDPDRP